MSQAVFEKKIAQIDLTSIEKVINEVLGKQGKISDNFTRDDLLQDTYLFILQTNNPSQEKLTTFLKNRLKDISGSYRNKSFSTLANYFEDEINVDEYVSAKKIADTPWDSDKKTRRVSGHGIKLTEAKVRDIFKLRSQGWTLAELAVHFSVSRPVISETLNRHFWKNVKLKNEFLYTKPAWLGQWQPKVPEHLHERILALRKDGKSRKEIGALVNYSECAIRRVLKQMDDSLENKKIAEARNSNLVNAMLKKGCKLYSVEIAREIAALHDEQKLNFCKISKLLKISHDSAWSWYNRYKGKPAIDALKRSQRLQKLEIAKKIVSLRDEQGLSFVKISKLLGMSKHSTCEWYYKYKGTYPQKRKLKFHSIQSRNEIANEITSIKEHQNLSFAKIAKLVGISARYTALLYNRHKKSIDPLAAKSAQAESAAATVTRELP